MPELVIGPVKLAFVVTVAALPVTLPVIGFITVRSVNVPTEVKEELTTVFKIIPSGEWNCLNTSKQVYRSREAAEDYLSSLWPDEDESWKKYYWVSELRIID